MDLKTLRKLKGKFKKVDTDNLPPVDLQELDTSDSDQPLDPKDALPPPAIFALLKHVFLTSMPVMQDYPNLPMELRARNITHVLYLGPIGIVEVPRVVQLSISSEVCPVLRLGGNGR